MTRPDALGFLEIFRAKRFASTIDRALAAFVERIEQALGGTFVIPRAQVPGGDPALAEILSIAAMLQQKSVITEVNRVRALPDEPRYFQWRAKYHGNDSAGGLSVRSEYDAVIAAVAEGVERSLWHTTVDYFLSPKTAKESAMENHIATKRFTGLRAGISDNADASFLWTKGYSWISKSYVYLPAQIVSGAHGSAGARSERRIRPIITTGLAAGAARTDALLGGALEVIERDAFMLMWLNQLSLPRIAAAELFTQNPFLEPLVRSCERYRLHVDFVQLVTDAPAYVIAAIIHDDAKSPPFALGISAGADAGRTAEKALLEALRGRVNTRNRLEKHPNEAHKAARDINHWERALYWTVDNRHEQLAFMTNGAVTPLKKKAWDGVSNEEHFRMITEWCTRKGYELVSVALTESKRNASPWYIEFVVLPELQPMHQRESEQCLFGARIREIPAEFGYTPRETPFSEAPHPFV